jgi:hypothetical protein
MLHPEKFVKLGIDQPKGILCYGPPETGKTLLACAVANQTNACFICIIGSEVVQKYAGERGSYGSWAVPGNVMLLSGWTSVGWADSKSLILCSTFRFQVDAGNMSCCSMFGTTGNSCVNLLSYKSVNFLFLCSIVLQSIYNLSLGPDGLI